MGLDMYALKIKADLIGDKQVDFSPAAIALEAVGFKCATNEEMVSKSDEERKAYWAEQEAARVIAKAKGIYDPEFDYWRKFNNLHGWMERLYNEKGGTDLSFNCSTVRLTLEDLERLETDAKGGTNLDPTEGFFFGSYDELTEEDKEEILNFTAKAKKAIADGYAVVYDSWW